MNRDDLRDILALISPLKRKLMLVANRAVVTLAKDTAGLLRAQAKVLDGEVFDDVEVMQPGGLTHVPLSGAEGVFLTIGGDRSSGVLIGVTDRRHRPKNLAAGETALYNESATKQTVIRIRANGDVEVVLAADAKLKVGGASDYVALAGKVDAALDKLERHVHQDPVSGYSGGALDPLSTPAPNAPMTFASVAATKTLTD